MQQNEPQLFPIDRIARALLLIGNALFLILFIVISYYDRIATDDFHFLALARDHDPITAMRLEYYEWSARWASVLLNQIVLSFHHINYSLFFFNLCLLALFIHAVDRLIGNMMHSLGGVKLPPWLRLNSSIFIVSGTFYASVGIDETWFWLCATSTYLVGMIMLILGVASIGSPRKGILPAIGIFLPFAYVGGSCEPLALFTMLVLLIGIGYGAITRRFKIDRLVIALIACAIAFIILYAGEGNRTREGYFAEIGLLQTVLLNVKTTGMIILLKLPKILPFVLLFTMPAALIGSRSVGVIDKRTLMRRVVLIGAIFFASIYIYQFPVTHVTQDIAADRALFPTRSSR